ncbi:MAG: nucleotidyltransferase domain-containing protein [Paraclostridium sp.]
MDIKILKKIAEGLNEINCTWGIGGSVMLNHYNIIDKTNDIDILIDENYTHEIKKFMETIGEPIDLPSKEPFKTKEFFGYMVDNTMVEFMGDFKIDIGNGKVYKFILDKKSITSTTIEDFKVNFTSLEDWFVAYKVMGDPKNRVPLIKKYFNKNGIKNTYLLERNLKQDLSKDINCEITEILK